MTDRIDFDQYAERYEGLLQDQLSFFSGDRGYFSDYKASLVRAELKQPVQRILDFGCGIGLTLPFLRKHFPDATLFATDVSRKSLEHVARNCQGVVVVDDMDIDGYSFDMILVAGVIHHVPSAERPELFRRLARLLSPDGELFVFEHNPFNPVTRRLVSTCPFDADAELVSRKGLLRLMGATGALAPGGSGYCLFFPQRLRVLRPLEGFMRWLPLGGQYFVRAHKA